jgi:hypothetical protein
MQIGGLQLECAVCGYDLFRPRRPVPLASYVHPAQIGPQLGLSAVACDRCGAVQLFDGAARSNPHAPIPPRRVARLRPGRHQAVDLANEEGYDGEEAEDSAVLDEAEPLPHDEVVEDDFEVTAATVGWDHAEEPGAGGDIVDEAVDDAGDGEPPPWSAAPSDPPPPVPWPSAVSPAPPTPAWPGALPPLPPLPPLEQHHADPASGDPAGR